MSTVGHHSGWTNICPQDKRPLVRGGAFVRGMADVLPSHSERGPRQVSGMFTRTFSPQVVKIVLQIWQERKINLRLALKRESLSWGDISQFPDRLDLSFFQLASFLGGRLGCGPWSLCKSDTIH